MLTVSVVSPERTLFEGEAESLVAPAYDGEVGIMSMHAPMLTLLGSGELRLNAAGGERRFAVFGGFLEVADDRVRIVTERAETK
ncbi:MAG TPA: ATP synthase F1 subunit epsilon [Gemmatimonadaceae bacterium]|nr:ATP synthase F1 subunit epsilon [Gemmatimonadaceae bacterium]